MSMMNANVAATTVMTANKPLDFELPEIGEAEFSNEELAEDMDGFTMSFPRIKIPAGGVLQFELPTGDPQQPDYSPTLTGVILFNHAICAYWPEGDEYSDDVPPLCSSVDGKQGYGEPGGVCEACALSQFGSASNGRGKACKNMRVLYLLRSGVDTADEAAVSEAVKNADITICYRDGAQQVILNGEDVSGLIRTEEVGNTASAVSVYPAVRAHLLELQRSLAASRNVIMDGRDIGTCILPDAEAKIYLTASSRVRAMRRYKELTEKGTMCNLEEIEQDIIERDHRDMTRETAPLKQAEDAVLLDSSEMTLDQVVQAIIDTAKARGLKEEA